MTICVHHGDSREVLKSLEDASIDASVTDPPYALVSIGKRFGAEDAAAAKSGRTGAYARASAGFMGQRWDTGETAFDPAFWGEVLRVLKPGAHLIAFSGTRTYHRMACAIEDAGFEIRDQIGWLYGSGFPKSHNQKGDWEGWGSALKPAWEPICVARKPLIGTIAENLAQHGTGALHIEACRIAGGAGLLRDGEESRERRYADRGSTDFAPTPGPRGGDARGRWPANVIHDGSPEVVASFPIAPGQQGDLKATGRARLTKICLGDMGPPVAHEARGDTGTAARFFYSAKADAEDRLGSKHPTVKPVDVMAWLCRLVTPPGGVVLDPFAGTGTTGLAAMREGFQAVLIEREADYVADINRRMAWARGEGRLTAQESARAQSQTISDLPLFGGEAA